MDRAIAFGAISWGFESLRTRAPLAQLAEHLTLNQRVEGSIPSRRICSMDTRTDSAFLFLQGQMDEREMLYLLERSNNRAGAGIW